MHACSCSQPCLLPPSSVPPCLSLSISVTLDLHSHIYRGVYSSNLFHPSIFPVRCLASLLRFRMFHLCIPESKLFNFLIVLAWIDKHFCERCVVTETWSRLNIRLTHVLELGSFELVNTCRDACGQFFWTMINKFTPLPFLSACLQ